jgi:fructokinase
MSALIGIDLGGTKIELAVVDTSGQVIHRQRRPTPVGDYASTLQCVSEMVALSLLTIQLPRPEAVGMAIPGCLDPVTHTVRGANSVVLNGKPMQADLERLLGCRVLMENDANCLAVSEAVDGAAAGLGVVFGVILGTGCGGGWALHGKAWRGPHALAGEWGHNPLPWLGAGDVAGRDCWCGQHACLETWLCGPGFAADHAAHSGQRCQPPEIMAAMRQGEPQAMASWDRYVDRLARALAQIINTMDPDAIVLGGGMSLVDELYAAVPPLLSRHTFTQPIHTPILRALHGDASGVRGAAWLAR